MPMRMSVSVTVSGHGSLADYLLGQGETSTCFTGFDIFQATQSAKTDWRQESGYSQHILSLKDNPHRLVHPLPLAIHATTKNKFDPAGGGRKTPRQRGVEGRKIGIRCRKTNARLILFLEGTILLSLFL